MNQRELRRLFAKHNTRSWQRVLVEAGKVKLPRVQNEMEIIEEYLINFKALRL
jgi:hypothetical protein